MLGEHNTPKELLTAFLHDAQWWKSALGYIETETRFIDQLLNAHIYKENTPNLFERLQKFKHEIETIGRETKNLKKEIAEYEDRLQGFLKRQDISSDTDYLEKLMELKDHFEEFYTGLNDYKSRVFNYIGGML
jgi:FtsZ-binding cell division protein ZapB